MSKAIFQSYREAWYNYTTAITTFTRSHSLGTTVHAQDSDEILNKIHQNQEVNFSIINQIFYANKSKSNNC